MASWGWEEGVGGGLRRSRWERGRDWERVPLRLEGGRVLGRSEGACAALSAFGVGN